ncbi:hypothetical protein [Streptomyces filamentosus]|uniref:hypothetical protein n=1 Tax=Streptomyces filamentosus TaxID=67294 RepID=UPI00147898C9|nr:hypothetical protein [Streptomyces filamentosus]
MFWFFLVAYRPMRRRGGRVGPTGPFIELRGRMFESDEVIRKNVQNEAVGLDRDGVAARREEAQRRYDASTPGYCMDLIMRREVLERYVGEWQRVLDEMTARGIERCLPADEKERFPSSR